MPFEPIETSNTMVQSLLINNLVNGSYSDENLPRFGGGTTNVVKTSDTRHFMNSPLPNLGLQSRFKNKPGTTFKSEKISCLFGRTKSNSPNRNVTSIHEERNLQNYLPSNQIQQQNQQLNGTSWRDIGSSNNFVILEEDEKSYENNNRPFGVFFNASKKLFLYYFMTLKNL